MPLATDDRAYVILVELVSRFASRSLASRDSISRQAFQ